MCILYSYLNNINNIYINIGLYQYISISKISYYSNKNVNNINL